MKFTIYSYRHAEEIIRSKKWAAAWAELEDALTSSPLFVYANKSATNPTLDVLQQVQNAYFDRRLAVDYGWQFHPPGTRIADSELAADFRKSFRSGDDELSIQVEVQFGNMSRWYSDVFKFQAAYSEDLAHLGISIVPVGALARRIDSNIVSYERCLRELPAAKLSITLPIMLIGVDVDNDTAIFDVSKCNFGEPASAPAKTVKRYITGPRCAPNQFRIVNGYLLGQKEHEITAASPSGPMPRDGSPENSNSNHSVNEASLEDE